MTTNPKTPALTGKQSTLLATALRAKREPKMSWMFTESHVLKDTDPRTIRCLEQKGMIRSYLKDHGRHTFTYYALTPEGESVASSILDRS